MARKAPASDPTDHARMDLILAGALRKVKPSREQVEAERAATARIMKLVRERVPEDIGVALVGSVSKGTNLAGDFDIDIFLQFPRGKYTREDLETRGLEYAKRAVGKDGTWEIGFAEHPYLKAEMFGCEVEIVPSFKIESSSQLGSAADRSPLHTRYVLSRMTEKERDEVLLLKKFLKRLSVYGAEVKVEGFSGYLCELLVIHSKTFVSLLREASGWVEPVIDIEASYPAKADARRKFSLPALVVVDPVDPNRNVAAAVSETSLSRFIIAARAFLKAPSDEFFFETEPRMTKRKLDEMRAALLGRETPHMYAMRFDAPDIIPDVLWPQLRRTARIIFERLEAAGFLVFDYGYWTDEKTSCVIIFELTVQSLPAIEKVAGPEIKHADGVLDFARKHRNPLAGPWVGGNRLYAAKKRRFTRACDLIEYVMTHPKEFAIPSRIAPFAEKSKRLKGGALLEKRYVRFVHDYIYKKHYYIEALGSD